MTAPDPKEPKDPQFTRETAVAARAAGKQLAALQASQRSALLLALAAALQQPDGRQKVLAANHEDLASAAQEEAAGRLAGPLVRAVAAFDPGLIISSSSSRAIEDAAAASGLRVATSFLADRAIDDQGLLVPRREPGAVIHDEAAVLARVRVLLAEGHVVTHSGQRLPMQPRSILVHGDTPGAVGLARRVRQAVEQAGGRVRPISQQFTP